MSSRRVCSHFLVLPLSLTAFVLLGVSASAQNPTIQDNIYYYTDTATINTDISGNDVVIGRSPAGAVGAPGDVNLGTTDATKFTVTMATGAKTTYNGNDLNDGYKSLNIYNFNTLNVVDGDILEAVGHDDSIINVSGGTSGTAGGAGIVAAGNSTANISGGTTKGAGRNTSKVFITGGTVPRLEMYDNATATISDTVNVDTIIAFDASTTNVTGGTVKEADIIGQTTLNVSGGSITTAFISNDSSFVMTGGTVTDLNGYRNSVLNLYGGTITNPIHLQDLSFLTIYGHDLTFSLTGAYSDAGRDGLIYSVNGFLGNDLNASTFTIYDQNTGTPSSGSSLNAARQFALVNSNAPEPASLAFLLPAIGSLLSCRLKKS